MNFTLETLAKVLVIYMSVLSCGKKSSSTGTTTNNNIPFSNPASTDVVGHLYLGFGLDANATVGSASLIDTTAKGGIGGFSNGKNDVLSSSSAPLGAGSMYVGAFQTLQNTTTPDLWGAMIPLRFVQNNHALISLRVQDLATTVSQFKFGIMDAALKPIVAGTSQSILSTGAPLTVSTASDQFPGVTNSQYYKTVLIDSTDPILTNWTNGSQPVSASYTRTSKTLPGLGSIAYGSSAILNLNPFLNHVNFGPISASVFVVGLPIFSTAIYSPEYTTTGASFNAPINGLSAKSSTASSPVLIVPNIEYMKGETTVSGGNTYTSGICDPLPTVPDSSQKGIGGGFGPTYFSSQQNNTITFLSQLWVEPTTITKQGLLIHMAKTSSSAGFKVANSTFQFSVNQGSLESTGLTISTTNNNQFASGTIAQDTVTQDWVYLSQPSLTSGAWNTIKIVFSNYASGNAANRLGCLQTGNQSFGTFYLYTYSLTQNESITSATTTFPSSFKIGNTTTTPTSSSGSLASGPLQAIPSTKLRFLVQ